MSKLLLNEQPLLVMPQLAVKIGLNESLILQQMHYWLQINEKAKVNFHDGYHWTYNTYEQWKEQFPFWSTRTIQRICLSLEKMNLLVIGNYNKSPIDKTKWYRINYNVLQTYEDSSIRQVGTSNTTSWHVEHDKLALPIPETNSKITTDNKNKRQNSEKSKIYSEDSIEYSLSNLLLTNILNNNPKFKQPNLQTWSKDMDYILRLDKREIEDVKTVINIATSDKFWRKNILSASKLRDKFDTLYEIYLDNKTNLNKGGFKDVAAGYKFDSVRSVQRNNVDIDIEDIDF